MSHVPRVSRVPREIADGAWLLDSRHGSHLLVLLGPERVVAGEVRLGFEPGRPLRLAEYWIGS